jgi:hypothetical protein
MGRRADLRTKMLRLKKEDMLGNSVEITRLRNAIAAIDAYNVQEKQRSDDAIRKARSRAEQKRNKPSLIWRVINWI